MSCVQARGFDEPAGHVGVGLGDPPAFGGRDGSRTASRAAPRGGSAVLRRPQCATDRAAASPARRAASGGVEESPLRPPAASAASCSPNAASCSQTVAGRAAAGTATRASPVADLRVPLAALEDRAPPHGRIARASSSGGAAPPAASSACDQLPIPDIDSHAAAPAQVDQGRQEPGRCTALRSVGQSATA